MNPINNANTFHDDLIKAYFTNTGFKGAIVISLAYSVSPDFSYITFITFNFTDYDNYDKYYWNTINLESNSKIIYVKKESEKTEIAFLNTDLNRTLFLPLRDIFK